VQECTSSCETEGVHVEVSTSHVGTQADLDPLYEEEEGVPQKSFYTYRVRVSNCGWAGRFLRFSLTFSASAAGASLLPASICAWPLLAAGRLLLAACCWSEPACLHQPPPASPPATLT